MTRDPYVRMEAFCPERAKKEPACMGDFIIEGAKLVSPDEVIEGLSVRIEDGMIAEMKETFLSRRTPRLDARGLYLLPGFVDLHSDALEKTIEPRPGAFFPINLSVFEFDKMLASCGITTMFHCVAFVDGDLKKARLRSNDMALEMVEEINRLSPRLQVTHRIHARFDILNQDAIPLLEQLVEGEQIHFLSVMDHTPGQGQFKDIHAYKVLNVHGYGVDPAAIDAMVEQRTKARDGVDPFRVSSLIDFCRRRRIPLASHDDDSEEKIEWVKEMGIGISEFPINMETARKAHEEGIFTAVGSPNVLRGSSWSNNLNARQMMVSGYGDIICSDYAPLTMLHAVFTLSRLGLRSLPAAVNMVSLHPARAIGMEARIGSVEEGKAADLILVDVEEEVPRIVRTLVAGRSVYSMCRTYRGKIPS